MTSREPASTRGREEFGEAVRPGLAGAEGGWHRPVRSHQITRGTQAARMARGDRAFLRSDPAADRAGLPMAVQLDARRTLCADPARHLAGGRGGAARLADPRSPSS